MASLGKPVIVENVTGAGGSIGVGRVAHATPDGYTIGIGNLSTHVINGATYQLGYDVVKDFAPVVASDQRADDGLGEKDNAGR